MSTEFSKSEVAIVSRGEDLHWFDTVPGEQMAIRIQSKDVGGAFTIIEAHIPPFVGPPLHYHEEPSVTI